MTNGEKNGISITRSEIKFWLAIISVAVTSAVWIANIQSQVNANEKEMQDKGSKLRTEFETDSKILHEVYTTVTRLETNQLLIMESFNLEPVKIAE